MVTSDVSFFPKQQEENVSGASLYKSRCHDAEGFRVIVSSLPSNLGSLPLVKVATLRAYLFKKNMKCM